MNIYIACIFQKLINTCIYKIYTAKTDLIEFGKIQQLFLLLYGSLCVSYTQVIFLKGLAIHLRNQYILYWCGEENYEFIIYIRSYLVKYNQRLNRANGAKHRKYRHLYSDKIQRVFLVYIYSDVFPLKSTKFMQDNDEKIYE